MPQVADYMELHSAADVMVIGDCFYQFKWMKVCVVVASIIRRTKVVRKYFIELKMVYSPVF